MNELYSPVQKNSNANYKEVRKYYGKKLETEKKARKVEKNTCVGFELDGNANQCVYKAVNWILDNDNRKVLK